MSERPPQTGALPVAAQAVNTLLRRAILAGAGSPTLRRLVDRYGMRLGGARFVAGQTLDEAVPVLRRLNGNGLATNTTLLGEHVEDEAMTNAVVEAYESILERIAAEGLRTNVALKLTHLGLDFAEELAYANVERVVRKAAALQNFVRIDMEESRWVDATLRVYRRLREAGHENVGTVLQAYLYRTPHDLDSLLDLRPRLRLVKGAYLEPEAVAFPKKADVDDAYARLLERMLPHCAHVAVATHDERLIERALALVGEGGIPAERYQLQLLYGVRPQLQLDLVRRGHPVLVATPFGPEWYPYLMRRLAERPANLLFVLRNLVRR
jgi:proline dehydrogenase